MEHQCYIHCIVCFQYFIIELKICFPLLFIFHNWVIKNYNGFVVHFLTAWFVLNRGSITFLIAISEVITVMIHKLWAVRPLEFCFYRNYAYVNTHSYDWYTVPAMWKFQQFKKFQKSLENSWFPADWVICFWDIRPVFTKSIQWFKTDP